MGPPAQRKTRIGTCEIPSNTIPTSPGSPPKPCRHQLDKDQVRGSMRPLRNLILTQDINVKSSSRSYAPCGARPCSPDVLCGCTIQGFVVPRMSESATGCRHRRKLSSPWCSSARSGSRSGARELPARRTIAGSAEVKGWKQDGGYSCRCGRRY